MAAAHRPAQAQQADVIGRRVVVGVVVVKADFDIGLVGTNPRTRQCLLPGVEHVVDQGAVELLRDRARNHARQQPIDRGRLAGIHLVERQPVDDRKAHTRGEHRPRPRHRLVAGRHREILRAEDDRRQRVGAQLVDSPADLVEAGGVEFDPPILGADIGAHPGARPFDRPVRNRQIRHGFSKRFVFSRARRYSPR